VIADEFFRACAAGDIEALRRLLSGNESLARERTPEGSTGLHLAAAHPEVLRLLISHGANPNARDESDNATPLHIAAAHGQLESVRLLLDAGADVDGTGDLHKGDVIGWAARPGNEAVINLLLERGAHHHIFSAMALGDLGLIRKLVEEDPECLLRRRSRFENSHAPVHAAFAPPDGLGWLSGKPDYEMLKLLIELGADVEAKDDKGRTPLAIAMLRGDREAIRLLKAAGAEVPQSTHLHEEGFLERMSEAAATLKKTVAMFSVPDMRATVRWYESIGFTVAGEYEDSGELVFARLTFGIGEFALGPGDSVGPRDVTFWFFTDRIQELYELLKNRQLRVAHADAAGTARETEVRFANDLHAPFYGGLQFSILDINGLELVFYQPPSRPVGHEDTKQQ
jgi:ankyrin repeat protein